MLHSEIKKRLDDIRKLMIAKKIKHAYLFGSACTESFGKNSDIDILIAFQDGLDPVEYGSLWWELYFALEEMLGRQVDLVTESSVKNPYFRKELDATKQKIL
jgi:predicted nucleotidyltransferase